MLPRVRIALRDAGTISFHWEPSKHPRVPAGSSGEFASSGTEGGAGGGSSKQPNADPSGFEFVSPSITPKDFGGAVKAIQGEHQKQTREAWSEIDRTFALQAKETDAIGAWSDGAEPTMVTTVQNAEWDHLKLTAAMKGHLTRQKAVLVFLADANHQGTSALYHFKTKGALDEIHKTLLASGVAFHTLVPGSDGSTEVYVCDLDGSMSDAVGKVEDSYGSKIDARIGRAEFVGTEKSDGTDEEQRSDAQRAYESVIEAGSRSALQPQERWAGIRNRWAGKLGQERVGSKGDFDVADHPRTQAGSFVVGGSAQPPEIKPPSENVDTVIDSNFDRGRDYGDATLDVDKMDGGVRMDDPGERKRVEQLIETMKSSGGYISRLLADLDGNVIEGQHRFEALKALGYKKIPVRQIDEATHGLPADEMRAAIEKAGPIHSDHVGQVMEQVASMLAEENGDADAVLRDCEFPAKFEKHFEAALAVVKATGKTGDRAFFSDEALSIVAAI